MISFVLVNDSLNAHHVRTTLAKNNTTGVKVGNFSQLLDMLFELWLLPDFKDDWNDKFRQKALTLENPFWKKSLAVDESATLSQIRSSLNLLLEGASLRTTPTSSNQLTLQGIKQPRLARYFDDIAKLWSYMDGVRPHNQMRAKLWLENNEQLSIEALELHLLVDREQLPIWQLEVVEALEKLNPVTKSLIELKQPKLTGWLGALAKEEKAQEKLENLPLCISTRDLIAECEAVASILQTEIEQGVEPSQLAVMLPNSQDYRFWLSHYLKQAGLNVSNDATQTKIIDWQTQLINDLLIYQLFNQPLVQLMSIVSNPLMPWQRDKGQYYATRVASGDTKRLDEFPKDKAFIDAIVKPLKERTTANLIAWLNPIISGLTEITGTSQTKARMADLSSKLSETLADYSHLEFDEQLQSTINQFKAEPLVIKSEERHRLDAITFLDSSHPYLGEDFHRIIVMGFNEGNYEQPTPASGAIPFENWQSLELSLNGKTTSYSYPHPQFGGAKWIADFAQTLGKSKEPIVITAARHKYDGGVLHLSNSWLALAQATGKELKSSSLFTPIENIQHPLIKWQSQELKPLKIKELPEAFKFNKSVFDLLYPEGKEVREESPSSLETMMVSPLAWFFQRAGIESREWEVHTLDIMLQGTIAHKVFELHKDEQDKEASLATFESLFEEAVKKEAPFINLPQWHIDKANLKREIQKAYEAFVPWLNQTGWRITGVEKRMTGELFDWPMKGFIDAVLTKGEDTLILDYKKSKHINRLKRLNAGYDLQTYVYRQFFKQSDGIDALTGYYNLNDQTMVVDTEIESTNQLAVKTPDSNLTRADQSKGAIDLVEERFSDLKNGVIKLNTHKETKDWDKRGIKPYAFENELLALTMSATRDKDMEQKSELELN